MNPLYETIPFLAGAIIGLVAGKGQTTYQRCALWLGPSVIAAFAASWLSGELALGWEMVLLDLLFVSGVALGVMALRRQLSSLSAVRTQIP